MEQTFTRKEPLVRAEKIVKIYKTRTGKRVAVDEISFDVKEGDSFLPTPRTENGDRFAD